MRLPNHKHLGCEIHLPAALKGEALHGLPPYALTEAFPVDAFPGCPENWERGGDNDASFFVVVKKNQGLWINLNNCTSHTHDVAVVISVQGVNPLTGKPAGTPTLEQYKDGPVPQNYIATTGTPAGLFWLDGFRGVDGEVRQYVLTEETIRGVAAQVMGEARSFSIGLAFFLSKKKKPTPPQKPSPWMIGNPPIYPPNTPWKKPYDEFTNVPNFPHMNPNWWNNPNYVVTCDSSMAPQASGQSVKSPIQHIYCSSVDKPNKGIMRCSLADSSPPRDFSIPSMPEVSEAEDTDGSLEIAAGARINQQIYKDPKPLDYWEDKPTGIIYIHYVNKTEGERILVAGRVGAKQETAVAGLIVGN